VSHDQRPNDAAIAQASASGRGTGTNDKASQGRSVLRNRRVGLFWTLWRISTALLVLCLILLAYSAAREYSTRRYLKGFSDAIVPVNSKPIEKVQAILNWMSGPAAEDTKSSAIEYDRNPVDTLNNTSLLEVCGTATNAFINLADSAGLSARRLLLLDSNRSTKHVVVAVLIDGRWIVVDPVFRYIPRGPDGSLLTRTQLADPVIFAEATRNVSNYDPAYNFQITAHVHLARIPYIGGALRRMLDTLIPAWSDSSMISLLLERSSLALLVVSIALVVFAAIWRMSLRWYAAAKLGIRPPHLTARLARACTSFCGASD
jgi:hypothetical protein